MMTAARWPSMSRRGSDWMARQGGTTAKGRVPGGIGDNFPNKHRKALDRNTATRSDATRPASMGYDVMIDEDFFALPIFWK